MNLASSFRDLQMAIAFELRKLQILFSIGIPLLLLNFIPGAGSILSSLGGVALGATIVCLDFLNAPLERRKLPFQEKFEIIRASLREHSPVESVGDSAMYDGWDFVFLRSHLADPLCTTRNQERSRN
jgi:uncharacterized protein involved in cysteine biosynthesis